MNKKIASKATKISGGVNKGALDWWEVQLRKRVKTNSKLHDRFKKNLITKSK